MKPSVEAHDESRRRLARNRTAQEALERWGLTGADGDYYALGLRTADNSYTIPFYDEADKLIGVKRRFIDASHTDKNRFNWVNKGRAPAIYLTPGCLDGELVTLTEGAFKTMVFEIITERATGALASGVGVGIPEHGRHLLRGKYVAYIHDPDGPGIDSAPRIAEQVRGIAAGFKAIAYPPQGWTLRGEQADDLNDVLRIVKAAYGPNWELARPGMKAKISAMVDAAPDVLADPLVTEAIPAEAPATDTLIFPEVALVGLAAEIAHAFAERVEAPVPFLFIDTLTYLGACVCTLVRVRSPFESDEPRIYAIKVAPSGTGRKSSGQQLITRFYEPLIEGRVIVTHGVGSAEGLAKRMEAGGSAMLQYDEFRSFVDKSSAQGSVLLPMVGSLFSTTRYENATKASTISLTDAHLSMVGACTTETFTTMFNPQFRNIGFLNRLFIVTGHRTSRKAIPEEVPGVLLKALQARTLQQIARAEQQKPRLDFTAPARRRWEEWYHALPESPYHARLDTYGFRLAALYAVTTESWIITLPIVDAVLALLDYQAKVRRELDPIDAMGVTARMERFILRALTKGRMGEGRLHRLCNIRHYGLWSFNAALKNLKAQEWVQMQKAGRGNVLWLTEAGLEAANE